jgi:hypothetical protein
MNRQFYDLTGVPLTPGTGLKKVAASLIAAGVFLSSVWYLISLLTA